MLIVTACIAGGVLYAGLKVIVQQRPRHKGDWLALRDDQPDGEPASSMELNGNGSLERQIAYRAQLSAVTLGVSMVGAFGYPSLSLASIPLNVYTSIPIFEQAYQALFIERRIQRMSVVFSVSIVGTLATQRYVFASLLTWLYNVMSLFSLRARRLVQQLRRDWESYESILPLVYGARPQSVWVLMEGVGIEIPFEALKVGDVIVVGEREVVPVEGIVVSGTARVTRILPPNAGASVHKGPGDHIAASTLLISGNMHIRVERL